MSPEQKLTPPYGSWPSPITSDVISGAGKTLAGTAVDFLGRLRPTKSGGGGGGDFSISGDTLIFSNYKDQRLYKQPIASTGDIRQSSIKYKSYFSSPEFIEFPTVVVPGEKAYAYYYPPTFVELNYGGSIGYGREFRERLLKQWGIVDVNNCCSCAQFLVASGKADGERLCITGGSAGGYTTSAALAFKKTFNAGASLYGVADVKLLKEGCHKFELYYMDNLVGGEKEFIERSPINSVDRFSCPIILFQGLEDKVVPPEQARKIYKALKSKGLPVALVEYEGEQHGFRMAENIRFTLVQEMVFFTRLVGHFKVADKFTLNKIDNFD